MIKKTICLNMIVKNESRVIRRCFDLVKRIIDFWIIVDTGSTDGSQEIIAEFVREVPGALYEQPFVDFATNRNNALDLAQTRADYVLLLDADECLFLSEIDPLPLLDRDYYVVEKRHGNCLSQKTILVRSKLDWKWEEVGAQNISTVSERQVPFGRLT